MKRILLLAFAASFTLSLAAQTNDAAKPTVKPKEPVSTQKKAPPKLRVQSGKATAGPATTDPRPGPTTTPAPNKKMAEIKSTELPRGVHDWVAKNVPGGKITRSGKIEENGILTYVAVVTVSNGKHAYLFDKSGNFTGKGDHLFPGKGRGPRR